MLTRVWSAREGHAMLPRRDGSSRLMPRWPGPMLAAALTADIAPLQERQTNVRAVLGGEQTDEELLVRVGAGEAAALEALYDRYQGIVMAIAYRMLGERGAAEETVQEIFLTIWRRALTFDGERGSARTWLISLARNRAIDRLRRVRAAPPERDLSEIGDFADTRLADVFDVAYMSMRGEQVRGAVEALPDDQRQIIELAYFGGWTQQKISEATGVALGTVKSRTRLALTRLKQTLDRDQESGL